MLFSGSTYAARSTVSRARPSLLWGAMALAGAIVVPPAIAETGNPYLAQSYNSVTHWDHGGAQNAKIVVPRGFYDATPASEQLVPNESVSLPLLSDKVNGKDVYWWWAGFSLRKLTEDHGQLVELAHADIPVKLPNYTPVTPEQRREQAAKVQSFLDAKDEKGLLDYMKSQPNRMLSAASDQIANGAVYAVLTRDDAFIGCSGRTVFRIDSADTKNPASPLKLTKLITLPANLFDNEKAKHGTRLPVDMLFGLSITHNGFLVVNTLGGKVITLDRHTLDVIDSYTVAGNDELFLNSFATGADAHGGSVYVASNTTMYRLVVDAHGKIHDDEASGAWKAPYERGERMPPPKLADGTGSTPSLMGFGPKDDKLVVITDGAKKMHLVAFWRDQIPAGWKQKPGTLSPRIADQREVDLGPGIDVAQSEQQVSVFGNYAFVVNNIAPDDARSAPLDSAPYYVNLLLGATRPAGAGAATMIWQQDKHAWKQLWARPDVASISVVPMISGGSHMAIIDGYFTKRWNDRQYIGMDLDTGKTVMTIRGGTDPIFNGMYSPIKVDLQGHFLYGTAFGLLRLDANAMRRIANPDTSPAATVQGTH